MSLFSGVGEMSDKSQAGSAELSNERRNFTAPERTGAGNERPEQDSEFRRQVTELVNQRSDDAIKYNSTREYGLHELVLVDDIKDPNARKMTAVTFNAAAVDEINKSGFLTGMDFDKATYKFAAAQVSDTETARLDKDARMEQLQADGRRDLGNAAGVVATGITAVGMDLLLEATKSTLPPGVVALAAIALGGLVNNKVAGRNALAHEGFLSNTLRAGGLYAGGWVMAGGDEILTGIMVPLTSSLAGTALTINSALSGWEKMSRASNYQNAWDSALKISGPYRSARAQSRLTFASVPGDAVEAGQSAAPEATGTLRSRMPETPLEARLAEKIREGLQNYDASSALNAADRLGELFRKPYTLGGAN
jgi:hypothetical protein